MPGTKTERRGYVTDLTKRFEQGAEDFMKAWRTGARRSDRIGEVSYRSLELVHSSFGYAAKSLGRLEKATLPPERPKAHPHAVHAVPITEGHAEPQAKPTRARHTPGEAAPGATAS